MKIPLVTSILILASCTFFDRPESPDLKAADETSIGLSVYVVSGDDKIEGNVLTVSGDKVSLKSRVIVSNDDINFFIFFAVSDDVNIFRDAYYRGIPDSEGNQYAEHIFELDVSRLLYEGASIKLSVVDQQGYEDSLTFIMESE